MKKPFFFLTFSLSLIFFSECTKTGKNLTVFYASDATQQEILAAREIRKYIYLRTGELATLKAVTSLPFQRGISIVSGVKGSRLFQFPGNHDITKEISNLSPDSYLLRTIRFQKHNLLIIAGGDVTAILYGAYAFARKLGIGFYLYGDIIPDKKTRFMLPVLDEIGKPLFKIRGILPFHDFPEGPDWWSLDEYKAILAQLPKLKMNFIGFHTYPQGAVGPEPTVWIGLPQDLNDKGQVIFGYPARHFTNHNGTWGYASRSISNYDFGVSQLFARDNYGADYMYGRIPWPGNTEECNALFNNVGNFFNKAFTFAHHLGIKTCVGTEIPLTIPSAVKKHLKEESPDLHYQQMTKQFYEGIFTWVKKNYPLDYYWFWTPEKWTWNGNTPKELQATTHDLQAAIQAVKITKAPFSLATCGWVLGPQENRAMYDTILPKNMPMSCINRDVGFSPIDPAFNKITGRDKWAIPWLEDDPALTIPQLWADRMLKDAADATKYGCTGLIGIHWRTRILSPNVLALADAAWKQSVQLSETDKKYTIKLGGLPVTDLYTKWAKINFGNEVGDTLGKIFALLDGKPSDKKEYRTTRLPRPADWIHGPGGVQPDKRSWEEVKQNYLFVNRMEQLRPLIKGKGNLERFDFWLNQFRYLRSMGKLACSIGEFNKRYHEIAHLPAIQRTQRAKDKLLPVRIREMQELKDIYRYLLNSFTTTGGLGTLVNWEQHIHSTIFKPQADSLRLSLGGPLPPEAMPSKDYPGTPRIIIPVTRTVLQQGEDMNFSVLLPAISVRHAKLFFRPLGSGRYKKINLIHKNRAVYSAKINRNLISGDFEYYFKIISKTGKKHYFPATAPKINQTVVILPENTSTSF